MSSTFLGLNTAYTGLQAANAALNTTANNISNVDTKGYSRQLVTTQAAEAIRSFTTYGCVGAGVETLAIERVRDDFYDQKFWDNHAKLGEYSIKEYYMSSIQNYYLDDEKVRGFGTIFEEFYKTIQEVAKNPHDNATKMQMIGYATNLTTYFSDMSTNLEKLQSDVNQEIKINVDRINSISQEVASLNKQINIIEMNTGAVANELRDQRDLMIDELSEIVGVEVEEQPIIDYNDVERDTGGTRYIVTICGQNIVDGNDYRTLTCVPRAVDERVNLSDIDGLYDVYFSGDKDWTSLDYRNKAEELNVASRTTGGKLSGLVQMRDGNNAENFAGGVSGVDEAAQVVTVQVKADYLIDLNKVNLPIAGGTIKLGNTNYYYDSWTYQYNEDTGVCSYTFQLDKAKNGSNRITQAAATGKPKPMEAVIGNSINYQGIPYYMSQMTEWVRMYASKFNGILQQGVLDNGNAGGNMFTGTNRITGDEFAFAHSYERTGVPGNVIEISSDPNVATGDTYYQLTAGNFAVVNDFHTNPALLATRTTLHSGVEDNDIIEKLINLKTDEKAMSFRSCGADQFLVCIMSDVALNAQRAETFSSNYKMLKTSIDNQRLSVSGVDNDEEAVNLTKFKQQYNMASKMIQTLTEIYDRLILQTGV